MQNAGQQYGQGGASSHQPTTAFGHSETTTTSGGSITSSLRQFRRKPEEKHHQQDTPQTTVAESHVARVAPHNHFPHNRTSDCYPRYTLPYQDYSVPSQVKYSEISEPHQPIQEHISPTVIQKAKGKEYMEMCNIQQPHMKQPYADHLNGQHQAYPDPNVLAQNQYIPKEAQVQSLYKPESQYYPKEHQYPNQLPHQMQKYNMAAPQVRKFPENDFLSKLQRIHPTMARSIMSDHHLQESQRTYQNMDQSRMYSHHNQRYMNHSGSMQGNLYPHSYMPPQPYSNYPASCSYTRSQQMAPRFPAINPHERSISPRRTYSDGMTMTMGYGAIPQKISPNYHQYNSPEYTQHYQQRRSSIPQDYYQQHCRPSQYLPHQLPPQEIPESRVTVSDNIKQYIENWADEETATEMTQIENSRMCKENIRVREDQPTETVYTINASELQYLEPLVAAENGIPVVASENGQYIIKSGVSIDNTSGMIRIIDKNNQMEVCEPSNERIVNLHIMDPIKPDCMLANKPNELNQRQTNENLYNMNDKARVVIHQNTVIQSSFQNPITKEPEQPTNLLDNSKLPSSLPVITDEQVSLEEELNRTIIRECRKETADKNCSPINLEQLEALREDESLHASVICPIKPNNFENSLKDDNSDLVEIVKNMPNLEEISEEIKDQELDKSNENTASETKEAQETETVADAKSELTTTEETNQESSSRALESESKDAVSEENEETTEEIKASVDDKSVPVDSQSKSTEEEVKDGLDIADAPENSLDEIHEVGSPASNGTDVLESSSINESSQETSVEEKPAIVSNENDETLLETGNEEKPPENPNQEPVVKPTEMESISDDSPETVDQNSALPSHSDPCEMKVCMENRKRSKRIFSVDDIINNIGNTPNKSKPKGRKYSLQTTREFLDHEIEKASLLMQEILRDKIKNDSPSTDKHHQSLDNVAPCQEETERETVEETKSHKEDTEVSLGDAEVSLGDAEVPLADTKLDLEGAKPLLEDIKPLLGETKPPLEETKPMEDTELSLEDAVIESVRDDVTAEDSKDLPIGRKVLSDDICAPPMDIDLPSQDVNPSLEDADHLPENVESFSEDIEPPSEVVYPSSDDIDPPLEVLSPLSESIDPPSEAVEETNTPLEEIVLPDVDHSLENNQDNFNVSSDVTENMQTEVQSGSDGREEPQSFSQATTTLEDCKSPLEETELLETSDDLIDSKSVEATENSEIADLFHSPKDVELVEDNDETVLEECEMLHNQKELPLEDCPDASGCTENMTVSSKAEVPEPINEKIEINTYHSKKLKIIKEVKPESSCKAKDNKIEELSVSTEEEIRQTKENVPDSQNTVQETVITAAEAIIADFEELEDPEETSTVAPDNTEESQFTKLAITETAELIENEIEDNTEESQREEIERNETSPDQFIDQREYCDDNCSKSTNIRAEIESQENEITDLSHLHEIQYRNVIRVEESSVLLHIAGELVEINVNTIAGKKVITVVPLSSSAVVDLNDNYETLDSNEDIDPLKLDSEEHSSEVLELEQSEFVEPTSEIIIGMDLSLEEEIQLDLEQPQRVSTKAAKKAYDSDLQIPSITTSEDVYDNIKTSSYCSNDKVSSSHEQFSVKKRKCEEQKSSLKSSKSKPRATKKRENSRAVTTPDVEDDEFVPFKELIKARKLKKMKMLEMKNCEEMKADSTNKIGEFIKEASKELGLKSDQKEKPAVEKKKDPKKLKNPAVGKPSCKKEQKPKAPTKLKEENSKNLEVKKSKETPPKAKPVKKVTFNETVEAIKEAKEIPEIKDKKSCTDHGVLPETSEIKDSLDVKKKLSLEEYNSRKRKLVDKSETEICSKRTNLNTKNVPEETLPKVNSGLENKLRTYRPKSLDDISSLKSKEYLTKRKLSLENPSLKPKLYDWEETQSPKTTVPEKTISDLNGLTDDHKPTTADEILQNYKEQVESKLSSLNIQIPRVAKPVATITNPFSKSETTSLMERFLKNEPVTPEEMQKIRQIISYKRLMQRLKTSATLSLQYEVKKELGERDMKLHLKKLPVKKRKKRFRNLYGESTSETDTEPSENKAAGDYSVIQSVSLAGVVPKLIIKRKPELPLPFVKLERLDMGVLVNKKRRYSEQ